MLGSIGDATVCRLRLKQEGIVKIEFKFFTPRAFARFLIFLMGFFFLLITVGTTFAIPIEGVWFTPWGIILALRFGGQQYRSRQNNIYWKKFIRYRVLYALRPYVSESDRLWRLHGFRRTEGDFDHWRAKLWAQYPEAKANWREIVLSLLPQKRPRVGVCVPVYRLDFETEVKPTLDSLRHQTYPLDLIVVAFNDPLDPAEEREEGLRKIHEYIDSIGDDRFIVIDRPPGKREAMAAAFREIIERLGTPIVTSDGTTDVDLRNVMIVNADGDTVFDPDATAIGIHALLNDRRAQALTSNVQVINAEENRLTFQTYMRYIFANNRERAAQRYRVTCMSGPCMVMYARNVQEILNHPDEWEHQMFGGEKVGPGDDRQLTQAHLVRGLGVVYNPEVLTETECPIEIPRWKDQQLRWNRSALRGFFTKVNDGRFYTHYGIWSICDEIYLATFGFILIGIVLRLLFEATIKGIHEGISTASGYDPLVVGILAGIGDGFLTAGLYVLPFLVIVLLMNLIRTLAEIINNRDFRFWKSSFYLYYLVRYLVPIKVKAVVTLTNNKWLGRPN